MVSIDYFTIILQPACNSGDQLSDTLSKLRLYFTEIERKDFRITPILQFTGNMNEWNNIRKSTQNKCDIQKNDLHNSLKPKFSCFFNICEAPNWVKS